MIDPPPHWAASIGATPLRADSAAHPSAPRAGGALKEPPHAKSWEWEMQTAFKQVHAPPTTASDDNIVVHKGGCHCGAVRFEVDAPAHIVAWDCNCSDCRMRRNVHFVVPKKSLRLVTDGKYGKGGANALAEYRWGTGAARHLFCSFCGICPFYQPRSNPDGWAITFQCIDGGTIASAEVRYFDGLNWEAFYKGAGAAIKAFSKSDVDAAPAVAEATGDVTVAPPRKPPWLLWLLSVLEVVATFALPLLLILLATRNGGSGKQVWHLPGKPQP